jgi:hypothetical protein
MISRRATAITISESRLVVMITSVWPPDKLDQVMMRNTRDLQIDSTSPFRSAGRLSPSRTPMLK